MTPARTPPIQTKLPAVGTTIFTVMSALAAEKGAVNLGQGFPDFDCDPKLVQAVTRAMEAGWNQYPPMAGAAPLRAAVASKIEALYGRAYDAADEITITAGATQAILTAILAIVRAGDEVIVLEPCYDSYVPNIELAGGTVVRVPLTPHTFRPDFAKIAAAITPRTRAILVNTPHNPSATVWTAQEMRQLEELLAPTDVFVISDEVYEHMVFDGREHPSAARFAGLAARSFIMDDIRPLQELQGAIAKGAALFKPRDAYEYSLHSNDEGNYTNYAAANPPYGVIVQYYQKTPQKKAPKLEILDARGHVIRTVEGTRKVEGQERPRVPNKAGLNRYVWDFQIDGPVKWTGAAKEEYQGPNEGPGVPPGRYSVRMNLNGTTFTQAFSVKPDPRSKFTQADYERTYAFARKAMATFSNVDSMLNALDSAKKQLDSAAADAKKTNNADLQTQINAALAAREAVRKQLTADFHNDEDSIQQQGALREDLQGLFYASQGLVTPPNVEYAQRIDAEYQTARKAYNDYIGSLKNVSGTMQKGGLKPLTGLQPVR